MARLGRIHRHPAHGILCLRRDGRQTLADLCFALLRGLARPRREWISALGLGAGLRHLAIDTKPGWPRDSIRHNSEGGIL